jgi:enoyl-CoA hydratase
MTEAVALFGCREILVEQCGPFRLVTLNRPAALNALSLEMCRALDAGLAEWEADPAVQAVILRGAGDKAYCAGGDVRFVYEAGPAGAESVSAAFFRTEYRLNRRLHRFPKPCIALIDGIAMGGGLGVSVHGSHRIATERAVLAMPEAAIGLIPDIGATWFLDRCPGRIGRFLGLTGTRLGAADALYCGLATHFVPAARILDLTEALTRLPLRAEDREARIETCLADFTAPAGGTSPLAEIHGGIDRCFAPDSIEAILAALEAESADWAAVARERMAEASPTSLKLILRQSIRGKGCDIETALCLEYRVIAHLLHRPDFYEGIRALLIDKDRSPRWHPASLAEVTEAEVEACYEPLREGELRF